jgi:hypothetical protein
MNRIPIQLNYKARRQFEAFHDRKQRWAVLVCHRRAGKRLHDLVADRALQAKKPQ